jgi:hypothetical protein
MRAIDLSGEKDEVGTAFGLICLIASQGDGAEGAADNRSLGKLQDAIEAISMNGVDDGSRTLKEDVEELVLDDAHWALLRKRQYGANIPWLPQSARNLTKLETRLKDAKEVVPGAAEEEAEE